MLNGRNTRKLAIFVEGQTELLFVEKLVEAIAGNGKVAISKTCLGKKDATSRRVVQLSAQVSGTSTYDLYVLIVDCGGDSRIASDIRDNYDGLVKAGYAKIVGIRDVYPSVQRDDIGKLRMGLAHGVRTKPITVEFILAIMEIEAWFLSEHTHFERIHPKLTHERVVAGVRFNPAADDMMQRENPASDLNAIYGLEGRAYHKDRRRVQRTVDVLSYEHLYCEIVKKYDDLRRLVDVIDSFVGVQAA